MRCLGGDVILIGEVCRSRRVQEALAAAPEEERKPEQRAVSLCREAVQATAAACGVGEDFIKIGTTKDILVCMRPPGRCVARAITPPQDFAREGHARGRDEMGGFNQVRVRRHGHLQVFDRTPLQAQSPKKDGVREVRLTRVMSDLSIGPTSLQAAVSARGLATTLACRGADLQKLIDDDGLEGGRINLGTRQYKSSSSICNASLAGAQMPDSRI